MLSKKTARFLCRAGGAGRLPKKITALSLERPEVPDRLSRRDSVDSFDDGIGVDAIVRLEFLDRSGLAEVHNAEGL